MSTSHGAKTKGWVKNMKTGKKMSFQFNPETLDYGRGAVYSDASSPGRPYPKIQFVRGDIRKFTVDLMLHDKPYSGLILKYIDFFNALLPPEKNIKGYTRPPQVTYCQGYFIKKCVLEHLNVHVEEMNGNGKPLYATLTLDFILLGGN